MAETLTEAFELLDEPNEELDEDDLDVNGDEYTEDQDEYVPDFDDDEFYHQMHAHPHDDFGYRPFGCGDLL